MDPLTPEETQGLHRRALVLVFSQRAGQAYFNALAEVREDAAHLVRGTSVDPFYDDALLPYFFTYVLFRLGEPV